ncbi:uncharacterized protein F5147DRAFT_779766 [Suillus discolor]|uniref:Uncharacterized protein n=1 Tax=Suillus discolor TaxID=1912936 RepID=A0A9P7EWI4_9AGAM|nr:uncharacterized protein F5147DRAFT_779766 [Suillus discolor]KAG2092146.1 hypothetical protein F5147DRAFT_779766 [Suillus discolor]
MHDDPITISSDDEANNDGDMSGANEEQSAEDELKSLMKEWTSPIYALFGPIPVIQEVDKCCVHVFKCSAKGCKVTIRHFLNKKDARSTGNMRKHAKSCWGEEVLQAADDAKSAAEVRATIVASVLRDGSITSAFERKGKGKVTYSHRQHTRTESKAEIVKWVSESLRPYNIVRDRGFQCLMKTGRPEIYIPSPSTISRDVRLVFARTRTRIAKMFKEYKGRLNFTTDAL